MSYLQFPEVERVPRPVDLRKEIVVQHFAQQLEQIDLHLVEGLLLQQLVQLALPLLVVQRRQELPQDQGHLAAAASAATAAVGRAAPGSHPVQGQGRG